ncbi:hypothetical protein EV361DRAFT_872089 [Lentinula raphanica]|nr:hypothetical protein EV361DRAFT_872089 [Lentinula raphanica]
MTLKSPHGKRILKYSSKVFGLNTGWATTWAENSIVFRVSTGLLYYRIIGTVEFYLREKMIRNNLNIQYARVIWTQENLRAHLRGPRESMGVIWNVVEPTEFSKARNSTSGKMTPKKEVKSRSQVEFPIGRRLADYETLMIQHNPRVNLLLLQKQLQSSQRWLVEGGPKGKVRVSNIVFVDLQWTSFQHVTFLCLSATFHEHHVFEDQQKHTKVQDPRESTKSFGDMV